MRWVVAVASAVVAAFGVMLLDVGVVVWSALISAGILTSPTCSDVFIEEVTGVAPMCVRPTSLTVVGAATVVVVALLAGVVAYRLAGRPSRAAET